MMTNPTVQTNTVDLPKLLQAIDNVLEATGPLAEIRPLLAARIEANRKRSERHNEKTRCRDTRACDDTRIVLTRSGFAVECVKCGRILAVDAEPRLRIFGGGER